MGLGKVSPFVSLCLSFSICIMGPGLATGSCDNQMRQRGAKGSVAHQLAWAMPSQVALL